MVGGWIETKYTELNNQEVFVWVDNSRFGQR